MVYQLKSNLKDSVGNGWNSEKREKQQASLFIFEDQLEEIEKMAEDRSKSAVARDLLDQALQEEGLKKEGDG